MTPFVWAHRGASGDAPENTFAAFELAEQYGADGIELDVHLSRDGVPVVMHDETVDRTTNGRGRIADLDRHELLQLDAGSWFDPRFRNEPVPLLADVLEWIGDRLRLNIEIKTAAAGQAVLELIAAFPSARVLVSSFRHDLLFDLRRRAPELPLAFLLDSPFWRVALQRAVACRAESFHPAEQHVSRVLVNTCHARGLKVFPWTVDDPSRRGALLRIGVDGLFTNYPARKGLSGRL